MSEKKAQKNIIYPEVKLKDVFAVFWRGIRPNKWLLFVLIVSVVLAIVTSTIIPLFYKQFFDIISSGKEASVIGNQLFLIIFYVLGFNGLMWVFFRIATFANNKYEPTVMATLKQQSYDYLIQHSYAFFTSSFAGSLVQKVNRLSRAFERLTDDLVWNLLPLLVRIVSILVVLFFVNKWLALLIFCWTAVFLTFHITFS